MEQSVIAKKPLYKRWWVWVLTILLFFLFIGMFSGEDKSKVASTTPPEEVSPIYPAAVAPLAKKYIEWKVYKKNPIFKSDPNLMDGVMSDPSVIKDGNKFMMYYGGSKGDFSEPNTVYIFRATSNDGINWKRNSIPVLSPGEKNSWDSIKVETPSVAKIALPNGNSEYWMYYAGSSKPDTEDGFQMGLATSNDGINWKRHSSNPILRLGKKGDFDELSIFEPSILFKDGEYWLWYAGMSNKLQVSFGLAKSKDGVNWEKKGKVLEIDVERQNRKEAGIIEDNIIWNGKEFEMFYAILLDEGKIVGPIWHAISSDGITWKKDKKPILNFGAEGWTANGLASPTVLIDDGKYRMWYVGQKTDFKTYYEGGFGLAEKTIPSKKSVSSCNPSKWTKYNKNPLQTTTGKHLSPWKISADPYVLYDNKKYKMWYTAADGRGNGGIAYAESNDGLSWDVWKKPTTQGDLIDLVLASNKGEWDGLGVETVSVIKTPAGEYRMYYTGNKAPEGSNIYAIGLATSQDGIRWIKNEKPVLEPLHEWEKPTCSNPKDSATCVNGGVLEPSVIYDEKEKLYKMWYAALGSKDNIPTFRIGYAFSSDGIKWNRHPQPVLDLGKNNSWDDIIVSHPHVITDSEKYHMFYFGTNLKDYCSDCTMQPGKIGHAYSTDGINWQRNPNPIISTGSGWEKWTIGGPSALLQNNQIKLWYFGNPKSDSIESYIGMATASCR